MVQRIKIQYFHFFFFFESSKAPMISQCLWKKPIALQERSVSRSPDKKHQTKPPAFTESVGPAAPSLERVHVAFFLCSIDRIFSVRHRSAASCAPLTAKKIARGRESYRGDTCVPVVIETRVANALSFYGQRQLFFLFGVGRVRVGVGISPGRQLLSIGRIMSPSLLLSSRRECVEARAR